MNAHFRPILPAIWMVYALAAVGLTRAETITTIAGTGQAADGGSRGAARETNVGQPFGVELGPDGALYITEVANHRVRRLDLATGQLTTVAGCGLAGYEGDGGPATEARLNEPYEVRFDPDGNLYFVEMKNHVVRRVEKRTGRISTVAGTGKAGYTGDGGAATQAMLKNPHSIAIDAHGSLYIADIGNHRIRRLDLESGTIESIAGNGVRELPRDGAQANNGPMLGPRALFCEGRTLWIALREGHSVWSLDLRGGRLTHIAGSGKSGYSGDSGPARQGALSGPKGIAVGPRGHIYVVDTENQAIRKIDRKSGRISTVVGVGPTARGYAGDGGPARGAHLNRPHGICVGPDGAIYIGDTENHRIRRAAP